MASIALIGPDGAGKTTVARLLESSCEVPIRYLYMGVNVDASNVALPTTRIGLILKRGLGAKRREGPGSPNSRASARGRGLKRTIRSTARFVNLLADEWYRQIVSWWHQLRGEIVVYDRYYLFDYNRHLQVDGDERALFRLHRYLLEQLYPRPDLVIYLDAPATVLFERKGEGTLESLERRRQSFLKLGKDMSNFVRVDATRPLPDVCREILTHIERVARDRSSGARPSEERR